LADAGITSHLAEFVPNNQHLFFALVSKGWRSAWGKRRPKRTTAVAADTTVSQLLEGI